jgi:hypothetical protein
MRKMMVISTAAIFLRWELSPRGLVHNRRLQTRLTG